MSYPKSFPPPSPMSPMPAFFLWWPVVVVVLRVFVVRFAVVAFIVAAIGGPCMVVSIWNLQVECGIREVRIPGSRTSNEPSRRSLRAPTAGQLRGNGIRFRNHCLLLGRGVAVELRCAASEYDPETAGCDGSSAQRARAETIGPFPTEVPWRSGCLAAAACVD